MRTLLPALLLFAACGGAKAPDASAPAQPQAAPAAAKPTGDRIVTFWVNVAEAFGRSGGDCDKAAVSLEGLAPEAAAIKTAMTEQAPPPDYKPDPAQLAPLKALGPQLDACEKNAKDTDRFAKALDSTILTVFPMAPADEAVKAWIQVFAAALAAS